MLSNKKIEHMLGEESIEWNSQRVSELGLSPTYIILLDKLLPTMGSRCKTVILYGSWADGTSSTYSDLDLLFITEDEKNKRDTMTILKDILFSEVNNMAYDCKVLSIDDIQRSSKGYQYFAIWLMLSTGVVLQGYDLRGMLKLDNEKVRVLINTLLDSITDCLATVESNNQFSGICVQMAYISRTLYFIDKHLLKKHYHPESKTNYINYLLGSTYATVERVYREVAVSKRNFGELGVDPRIQVRSDKGYSQKQYQELHDACIKLENTILDIVVQLRSMQILI